jgi:hypothetical protein
MKKGLLIIFFILNAYMMIAGCTNSKPVTPEKSTPIYSSRDTLFFAKSTDTVSFYMLYLEGGTLFWTTSQKPTWLIIHPNDGYLTNERTYIEARVDAGSLGEPTTDVCTGTLTIYSPEGNKYIGVKLFVK